MILAVVHRGWWHALRRCRSILVWIIPEKTVSNPRGDFGPSQPPTFSVYSHRRRGWQTRAPGRRRVRRRGELLGLAGAGDGAGATGAAAAAQQTKQEIERTGKGRGRTFRILCCDSSLTLHFPSTPPRLSIIPVLVLQSGSYPGVGVRTGVAQTRSISARPQPASFHPARTALLPPTPIERYKRSRLWIRQTSPALGFPHLLTIS